MIGVIIKSIIIGILVSAPVGPLGVLCIQRTISGGKRQGFVTGLGASTSDLFYAMLVGFGMSFVLDFIHQHALIMQIIGSAIIAVLGFFIFMKNPADQLKKNIHSDDSSSRLINDYASALGLCITNPMICVLFIGLFAHFNVLSSDQAWWLNVIAIISILGGSCLWWMTLTTIVNKFRDRFNVRGLWILNKITGAILIISGIVGVVMALNGRVF